eukprot:scaffold106181_cov31-Tisochrysis_lutea.AAC.1
MTGHGGAEDAEEVAHESEESDLGTPPQPPPPTPDDDGREGCALSMGSGCRAGRACSVVPACPRRTARRGMGRRGRGGGA